MNYKTVDDLIQGFQNATRTLRQRAIILSAIMIIALGFIVNYNNQNDESRRLTNKWLELYDLKDMDSTTLKTIVAKSFPLKDSIVLRYIDYALEYKLRKRNYDNAVIFEEMQNVEAEQAKIRGNQTFNILGVETPLNLWLLISIILILFLFHEFTQILHYRRNLRDKLNEIGIEGWRYGSELFGFYRSTKESTSGNYISFISSLLTAIVLICPLATSLMFFDYLGHVQGNSYVLLLNVGCLFIIAIDTAIVFYKESIFGAGYLVDLFIGENNEEPKGIIAFGMWFLMPLILIGLHGINLGSFNLTLKDQIMYLLIAASTIFLFCLSLWMCYIKAENKIWKGVRFIFLTMNIFWIFIGVYTRSTGTIQHYLDSRFSRWINGGFIGILIVAIIFSILYVMFYAKPQIKRMYK